MYLERALISHLYSTIHHFSPDHQNVFLPCTEKAEPQQAAASGTDLVKQILDVLGDSITDDAAFNALRLHSFDLEAAIENLLEGDVAGGDGGGGGGGGSRHGEEEGNLERRSEVLGMSTFHLPSVNGVTQAVGRVGEEFVRGVSGLTASIYEMVFPPLQECGCCFMPTSAKNMAWCSANHGVCNACLKQQVELRLFRDGKTGVKCIASTLVTGGDCGVFNDKSRTKGVLEGPILKEYERVMSKEEVEGAGIALTQCPTCDFMGEVEEEGQWFNCPNCGRSGMNQVGTCVILIMLLSLASGKGLTALCFVSLEEIDGRREGDGGSGMQMCNPWVSRQIPSRWGVQQDHLLREYQHSTMGVSTNLMMVVVLVVGVCRSAVVTPVMYVGGRCLDTPTSAATLDVITPLAASARSTTTEASINSLMMYMYVCRYISKIDAEGCYI